MEFSLSNLRARQLFSVIEFGQILKLQVFKVHWFWAKEKCTASI